MTELITSNVMENCAELIYKASKLFETDLKTLRKKLTTIKKYIES